MKRYPISFSIGNCKIKHEILHLLEWFKFMKWTTLNADEYAEQEEFLLIIGGDAKWYNNFETVWWALLTKLNIVLSYDSTIVC